MRRMRTLNLMVPGLLAACPMTIVLLVIGGGGLQHAAGADRVVTGVLVYAGIRRGMPLEWATHVVVGLIMVVPAYRQAELGGLEMVGQGVGSTRRRSSRGRFGVRGAAV